MLRNIVFIVLAALAIGFLLIVLPTIFFLWGWNLFVVPVFGQPQVDFWMALAAWALVVFFRFMLLPIFSRKPTTTSAQPAMTPKQAQQFNELALKILKDIGSPTPTKAKIN